MSNKKDSEALNLNDKNKETKSLFDNLKQYKKDDRKEKDEVPVDVEIDEDEYEDINDSVNNSNNVYISLLENNNIKDEYIGATHYFRKDQLKDLDGFSKKTKKPKNEFMRQLIDLVFAELKKAPIQNQEKSINSDEIIGKNSEFNKPSSDGNNTSTSDNPFSSLLEVNDSKDKYVRATHYFRRDQLEDLEMFVKKSGKSKNEFVRELIDLVFSQIKNSKV